MERVCVRARTNGNDEGSKSYLSEGEDGEEEEEAEEVENVFDVGKKGEDDRSEKSDSDKVSLSGTSGGRREGGLWVSYTIIIEVKRKDLFHPTTC